MGRVEARTCGSRSLFEPVCDKPSAVHWTTAEGVQGGPCEEHRHVPPVEPHVILMQHAIGPNCGMPGSIFDLDENVCRYEEDELPVTEEKELELVG